MVRVRAPFCSEGCTALATRACSPTALLWNLPPSSLTSAAFLMRLMLVSSAEVRDLIYSICGRVSRRNRVLFYLDLIMLFKSAVFLKMCKSGGSYLMHTCSYDYINIAAAFYTAPPLLKIRVLRTLNAVTQLKYVIRCTMVLLYKP